MHLDKYSDDGDSIFSLDRFFETVIQIFVPVHKMQLYTRKSSYCVLYLNTLL